MGSLDGGVRDNIDRRRGSPRRPFSTDVCLFDESGEPVVLETIDLGTDGLFVSSELLYEPGEELWVSFRLPTGSKIVVRGRIVRGQLGNTRFPPGMGIEFVDLSDRERSCLGGFIEQGAAEECPWPDLSGVTSRENSSPDETILY